jgi:hypothetical protein
MSEHDVDGHQGAFEPEDPQEKGNTSLRGQLPHRGDDPILKSSDTDFPEPGENMEHSGEREESSLLEDETGADDARTKRKSA